MPRRLFAARRPARWLAVLAVPLALAGTLLPGHAARADQAGSAKHAPKLAQNGTAAEVGGFSQSQLESYANAVLRIQQIDRAWQPRIDQAQNEQEAEVLTTQATDEMVGEIQAQGLSVQEYNSITQAAQTDDRLYDHIMTLLAQR